jgi:phosphoribosylformylglycinamidine synthase I
MKTTLIPVFPGTNCEQETARWVEENLHTNVAFFNWEKHNALTAQDIDMIILPGGFSYGDFLRAGALAAQSKEMKWITRQAQEKVPILGICNGFQILCESKLLPGVLVKNITGHHHHFPVEIQIHLPYLNASAPQKCLWIPKLPQDHPFLKNPTLHIPMSCGMGNWRPPQGEQEKQNALNNQIMSYAKNENGSAFSLAGITNSNGNILGLMPHPERASDLLLGNDMGLLFLYGLSQHKHIKIKEGSALCKWTQTFCPKPNNLD